MQESGLKCGSPLTCKIINIKYQRKSPDTGNKCMVLYFKGCIIPPFHWDNRHLNSHGRMHCMLLLGQVGFMWLHQVFNQKSYSYDYI